MRILATLVFNTMFLALFTHAAANAQTSAGDVVKDTADKVTERLRADRENLEANPDQIYSLVDELVIPHFDFVSMSKWVLGRDNWTSASQAQQEEFIEQFRTLLVKTYAKALLEYSEQEIRYLPVEENPESNVVLIKTEVNQSGSKSVPIDYTMHISGGEWKVVNLTVDGISLVHTYKGEFNSEIRKNGIDSLLAKLSERNANVIR